MKVLITKDCMATIDNYRLQSFKAGETHDLRETVACRLIGRGEADYIHEGKWSVPTQNEIRE